MPATVAHSERSVKAYVRHFRTAPDMGLCYESAMKTRIKEFRTARRLSVEALAKAVGMSKSYVSEMENGRKEINGRRLEQFARFFGVPTADLLVQEDSDAEMQSHLMIMRGLSAEDRAAVMRLARGLPQTKS